MLRNSGDIKKIFKINVLIAGGGLGDLLSYLVVVNYILTDVPWIDPIIWVPDYLVDFTRNVLPKKAKIMKYSDAERNYDKTLPGVSTDWTSQHTPMRIHPIDYAAHMLIDGNLPVEKKNYLKFDGKKVKLGHFKLPENYVTIPVGSTSKAKELPVEVINQIAQYVKNKGYTPVFLGKNNNPSGVDNIVITAKIAEVDYRLGINLVDKTSIIETAAVIERSKAMIGMEGGLNHLAGFTNVPIVAGYSFIDPKIMMPIRNNQIGWNVYPVVPEESLSCRFCQSNCVLLYGHDFRTCIYKDFQCIQQLTFDKFKEQIDKCLQL